METRPKQYAKTQNEKGEGTSIDEEPILVDCQVLALYQGIAAFISDEKEDKLSWLTKAHHNHKRTHRNKRTSGYWRISGIYCHHLGVLSTDSDSRLGWYKKVLNNLSQIPEKERTSDDWRLLATNYYSVSESLQDPDERLPMLKEAINSFDRLPLTDRTQSDWEMFANYQLRLSKLYKDQSDWYKASDIIHSVLDLDELSYAIIARCYKKLRGMCNRFTSSDEINTLGQEVFIDAVLPVEELKKRLHEIHLQALYMTRSAPNYLFQVLKLMRLLDRYANRADFPNKSVVIWLSDKNGAQNFKHLLLQLEEAYRPSSLTQQLDQGHSMMMAIAFEIQTLKKRVNYLEDQNKVLQIKLNEQQPGYFGTTLTLFGQPVTPTQVLAPTNPAIQKIPGSFTF